MAVLAIIFKNELYKIWSHKKNYVFLIIGVLLCIIWAIVQSLAYSKIQGLKSDLDYLSLTMLSFFQIVMLPLLIFMNTTDSFSAEAGQDTLKAIFVRPVSRFKIYLGKLCAVMAYCATYLGVILISCILLSLIFSGSVSYSAIWYSLIAYVVTLIPLLALAAMSALLAQISDNPTFVMLICILVYLVLMAVRFFASDYSNIFFTSYLGWHQMWIGSLIKFSRLFNVSILLFSYIVVFISGGYYLFDKKDV